MNVPVRRILVIAGTLAVLSSSPARAATPYALREPSEQEIGCLWQCACPVLFSSPLKGPFALTPNGSDATYDLFTVSGVDWIVTDTQGQSHTATGNGTYRKSIAAASPLQRLELDLSLDGGAPLHFDSGVVPESAPWPAIEIDVSRHKEQCYDTLFAVRSSPAPAGITPHPATRLASPRPSPFRDRVTLGFSLESAASVELSIHDLAGRRVRTLLTGSRMTAGPHEILWDGYSDDGRRVPAGVLFVRFMAGGRTDRRLLVRVE